MSFYTVQGVGTPEKRSQKSWDEPLRLSKSQRVRIQAAVNQLEILFLHLTEGLLQQIHTVLQSVNRDGIALKF
jgi:hypothetical protein